MAIAASALTTSGAAADDPPPQSTEVVAKPAIQCHAVSGGMWVNGEVALGVSLDAPGVWYPGPEHDRLMERFKERRLRAETAEADLKLALEELERARRQIENLQYDLELANNSIDSLKNRREGFLERHIGKAVGPTFLCDRDGCRGGLGGTWGFTW